MAYDLRRCSISAWSRRSQRSGQARAVLGRDEDGDRRPLPETKQLVAGFCVWQVQSMEEALEWAKRCPDPMPGEEAEMEIRPIFEARLGWSPPPACMTPAFTSSSLNSPISRSSFSLGITPASELFVALIMTMTRIVSILRSGGRAAWTRPDRPPVRFACL
jgi:hypothetical protein